MSSAAGTAGGGVRSSFQSPNRRIRLVMYGVMVARSFGVLGEALTQIPLRYRHKILIRIDGAGATHDLLGHLQQLNTAWRTVRFTVGWTITEVDEQAIAALPEAAWDDLLHQDATATEQAGVAELTGLNARTGQWIEGLRLIVRRTQPSRRHRNRLTALEKRTGWRYAIVATNITRLWGVPGSHHPQWIDAVHRSHATVEDRVRTNKAMGLHNLPSKSWTVNRGWVLVANLAADIHAWTRLLGLYDEPDLVDAEPETLRYRLLHLPAKLTTHARRRWLSIPETWPWAQAFLLCWQRLSQLAPVT
jgi:Transposase DDE domain group 1